MAARIEPSPQQMQEALRAARCGRNLEAALSDPLLRILITNHAEALARQQIDISRARRFSGRADWRARAAGDTD